jgi:hypothetical protein
LRTHERYGIENPSEVELHDDIVGQTVARCGDWFSIIVIFGVLIGFKESFDCFWDAP